MQHGSVLPFLGPAEATQQSAPVTPNNLIHRSTAAAETANDEAIQMAVRAPSLGGQNLGAIS